MCSGKIAQAFVFVFFLIFDRQTDISDIGSLKAVAKIKELLKLNI